jgi:hypothetical protein
MGLALRQIQIVFSHDSREFTEGDLRLPAQLGSCLGCIT